jgi:uncharacterized membrane protein
VGEKPLDPRVARPRLDSVDMLRGLVMVVMALDHVRDFFGDVSFDALDLTRTSVPLYFTRWISHFCAPTFVFLTGVGAYLYGARGRTTGQISWYLFSRGLWLVVVEFVILTPMWMGPRLIDQNHSYVLFGQVFWAIGTSMVVLSALVWLPRGALVLFALVVIEGHNALDVFRPIDFGRLDWLWQILHVQAFLRLTDHLALFAAYPLIPWFGVMAAGYAFGPVLKLDKAERRTWILGLGALMTVGFFVLRATNVYGDLRPWNLQKDETFTVLSFLNCHKYPPSLCYVLMTLGPALLLLAAFEWSWRPVGPVLTVFGRVPMFYYLLHLPLILGLSLLTHWAGGVFGGSDAPEPLQRVLHLPYHLPGVYATWLLVVTILYFPCRWYAGIKSRSKSAWLTYL